MRERAGGGGQPGGRRFTEQYDDTEQDGNQGPSAQPRREDQGLRAARLHVSLLVAGAHADREGAGAALNRIIVVKD